MKKFLILVGFLFVSLIGEKAHAYTAIFDLGFSTAISKGFSCSSGTATQLDSDRASLLSSRHAGARVQNQGSNDIYIGYNTNVSSSSLASLGIKLAAGADATFAVSGSIGLFCIAEDAAGATGETISVEYFGF